MIVMLTLTMNPGLDLKIARVRARVKVIAAAAVKTQILSQRREPDQYKLDVSS